MRAYRVLERILLAVPVALGVALLVFLFMRLIPGDPIDIMMGEGGYVSPRDIEALSRAFHLDKPLSTQLWLFLKGLAAGDLGRSIQHQRPVAQVLLESFPATIELALGALIFALAVAVPIGVTSAVYQRSVLDRLSMSASFVGISMPPFWLGIVAILIFSVELQWLPTSGRLGVEHIVPRATGFLTVDTLLAKNGTAFLDALRHLILPSVTLGAAVAALITRVMRSSMLEVLRQDYVMLARSKGLHEFWVVTRHALRNALIPTVTVVGLQVGVLLGGNMIVETVFSWPGMGRVVVQAIRARDFPLVQGAVILYALTYVLANLVVDVLYTYLNPKITL